MMNVTVDKDHFVVTLSDDSTRHLSDAHVTGELQDARGRRFESYGIDQCIFRHHSAIDLL